MMRLAVIIILPISTLVSCVPLLEFAQIRQESSKPISASKADTIDIPSTGKGWHTIHKSSIKRFQKKNVASRKTDICLECHKKNKYRIFDPHTQINEKGNIIKEKCLYCHIEKPDEKQATFGINGTEIKFTGNLEELCLRCHSRQLHLAHPVNANHVTKPSAKMLEMMKITEGLLGVTLPLDYEGKIMCATCHNPHEKGVIPTEKVGAKGASEKARVRLPGKAARAGAKEAIGKITFRIPVQNEPICLACHRDK